MVKLERRGVQMLWRTFFSEWSSLSAWGTCTRCTPNSCTRTSCGFHKLLWVNNVNASLYAITLVVLADGMIHARFIASCIGYTIFTGPGTWDLFPHRGRAVLFLLQAAGSCTNSKPRCVLFYSACSVIFQGYNYIIHQPTRWYVTRLFEACKLYRISCSPCM